MKEALVWKDKYYSRIIVYKGDLGLVKFGLDEKYDFVCVIQKVLSH
jgi:thioester reductase-like protein